MLRGLTLSLQTLIGGGIVFGILAGRELNQTEGECACRRLTMWAALALSLVQLANIAADTAILIGTTGLTFLEVAGANFFLADSVTLLLSLIIAGLQLSAGRSSRWWSLLLSGGIIAASVTTSHAVARLDHRLPLALLTGAHYAATAAWVGGLPFLVLSLTRCGDGTILSILATRFSRLAQLSVGVLLSAGIGLSFVYIDAPEALLGTAYGAMVGTKIALFLILLALGAVNFLIVRQAQAGDLTFFAWMRRFAEVEIGVAFTVILAAGSLTSQPPAVDIAAMRVPLSDIAERFTPKAPRLHPPALIDVYRPAIPSETNPGRFDSYVPGQLTAPRTQAEIALSEFNHHWAGIFVLLLGFLAVLSRAGVGWARHWPLTFLALGVFLFFMADVDYWPLGPLPFWKGFAVAEVFQHRLVLPLIIAFAWYEWRIRIGKSHSPRAALVFPLVCALGGAVLITHTHSLTNYKEQLLAELSHIPIALFGIVAGWSRWLELRGPEGAKKWLSWIWPICFVLIGFWLLNYRES